MLKLGYSGFDKDDKPKCYWMDNLEIGDMLMSGVMHDMECQGSIHYWIQYEGFRKIMVNVRREDYTAHYEYKYDTTPSHQELLDVVYDVIEDMRRFF